MAPITSPAGWSYFGRILAHKSGKKVGIGITAVFGGVPIDNHCWTYISIKNRVSSQVGIVVTAVTGVVPIDNPRWSYISIKYQHLPLHVRVSLRCFLAGLKDIVVVIELHSTGDEPSFNTTLSSLILLPWERPPCKQYVSLWYSFLAHISERWQTLATHLWIRVVCVVPFFPLLSIIKVAPKTVGRIFSIMYLTSCGSVAC